MLRRPFAAWADSRTAGRPASTPTQAAACFHRPSDQAQPVVVDRARQAQGIVVFRIVKTFDLQASLEGLKPSRPPVG